MLDGLSAFESCRGPILCVEFRLTLSRRFGRDALRFGLAPLLSSLLRI